MRFRARIHTVQGSGTGPAQCDGFQESYGEGAENLFA